MKTKNKIIFLVSIQISLIVISFFTLAYIENQRTFAGNAVNIAGKNRFLASQTVLEIHDYIEKRNSMEDVIAINELRKNIIFLKEGGTIGTITLKPLLEDYHKDWTIINNEFLEIEKIGNEILKEYSEGNLISNNKIFLLDNQAKKLIFASDLLVEKLGLDLQYISLNLIILQIALAIINIGAHVLLIIVIFRMLKKESEEKVRNEKFTSIGELSARMAHDLRNPLNIVKFALQLINRKHYDNLDEKDKTRIELAQKAVSRMSHQIDEVMDFVRSKKVEKSRYLFSNLLDDVISRLEIPNSVIIHTPKNDLEILCDKEQMEIVLINLISNALDAVEKSGDIFIRIFERDEWIVIEIEDSGNKLDESSLSKIFEPLYTTKEKGTGLGLASCHSIIKNHGGNISAKVNPTVFSISIPTH